MSITSIARADTNPGYKLIIRNTYHPELHPLGSYLKTPFMKSPIIFVSPPEEPIVCHNMIGIVIKVAIPSASFEQNKLSKDK